MSTTRDHTALVNDLLVALGAKPTLGKWWKNNTGALPTDSGAYISYGLPGSPDIVGLLASGTWCGIEVKTGGGVLSAQQKKFRAMVTNYNGVYIEARDIQNTLSTLEALCSKCKKS